MNSLNQHEVPFTLILPPEVTHLIILSRRLSAIDYFKQVHSKVIQDKGIKVLGIVDPDSALNYRDRSEFTHLVVLEHLEDSLYFREGVGRVKVYFPFCQISMPLH